jgi:hypothetical protein
MNVMAYHFASGAAFFWGAALVLLGVVASWLPNKPAFRLGARVATILGLLFSVLSATPLPLWAYVAWSAVVLGWLVAEARASRAWPPASLRVAALLVSAGLVLLELPHHMTPSIPAGKYETLYIIGDSISSGIGLGEKT